MNILLIGTTDKLGGAAKISWEIKTTLEKKGHSVSMFVADKLSNDSNVKVIPRQKWRKILGFIFSIDDLLKTDWILKTKEFKEADIIHCHNLHGRFFNLSTLKKMSNLKPLVWTLHDEWAITPHCACTFEGDKIENGLFSCPDISVPPRLLWNNTRYLSWRKNSLYKKSKLNIVAPSNWLKKRIEKTILGNQKIKLIYNGIDTKIFQPKNKRESRSKLGLPMDKKIILFLADSSKESPWKGWKYAEEIINRYQDREDILFLNVGNLSDVENIKNVHFVKRLSDPKDVSLYYNAADIFLFTSIAENFPLVILEAMACGLPIVSFDVGGVKEALIHKVNGYLAEYKNKDSLLDGVKYLLTLDESELQKIKEASSSRAKSLFSVEDMIEDYMKLYDSLIIKMDEINKNKLIETIVSRESLRNLSRLERLIKDPVRTIPFYFLATISHLKPFKISFHTLWGKDISSYLPDGNTFYYYGFCEANLTNFLLRFLKRGDFFVDIGAHIGFYSMLSSELVGEVGRVFSFEPTPRTFDFLKKNSESLKNVKLFNIALSNKNKEIIFSDYGPGYGAFNSGHKDGAALLNKTPKVISIKTETLDNILKEKNIIPDIIKLDAEGLEYDILQGMKSLFSAEKRPLITLEVAGGSKWKENYHKSINFLLENNYEVWEMKINGYISRHKIKETYEYDNLLFIPKEKVETLKYLYDNS